MLHLPLLLTAYERLGLTAEEQTSPSSSLQSSRQAQVPPITEQRIHSYPKKQQTKWSAMSPTQQLGLRCSPNNKHGRVKAHIACHRVNLLYHVVDREHFINRNSRGKREAQLVRRHLRARAMCSKQVYI